MARNLFGGTAADVAETVDGARVPGAVGTVWSGPSDGAVQLLDLTDADGAPIVQLVADQRGFIPSFYGPDSVERLWVDFGNGRIGLVSVTAGERLSAHEAASDPHQDRAYTNDQLTHYMRSSGGVYSTVPGADWQTWAIPTPADATGTVWKTVAADGTAYTRLNNTGTFYIDVVGQRAGLCIGAPAFPASQAVINVTNARATPATTSSVFQVRGDGSVVASGSVSAAGGVVAPNVGTARVYSGPNAPAAPQAGDVWVQYA